MIPILLVDDNPTNLKVLTSNLSGLDYKLLTATTGERALTVAENALPELILLDINLPGISGFEVCEKLKANPLTQAIPIIFLSALDDTASKVKGFEVGGVDYVTKPFQREEVIARVTTQLRISALTKSLEHRNKEIEQQKQEVEEINAEVTASIMYASRIQKAVMPQPSVLQSFFKESFVFFQPRNIVSGDFYWFAQKRNKIFVIMADCTGHGVPGAFVSLLGMNILAQLVEERGITEPASILEELDLEIQRLVNQPLENGDIPRDGMDISVCVFDTSRNTMQYACAGRPVYVLRNQEVLDLRGEKCAIGGEKTETKIFNNNNFALQSNDKIYLFSDGFVDQFGGEENKKLTSKRFQQFILDNQNISISAQKTELEKFFTTWKGNVEQTDDVLVLGIEWQSA